MRVSHLIIFLQGYTVAMDMWSIGCILAEMLNNRPIFPGSNYLDQITKIQKVLGSPSNEDVAFIRNSKARSFITSLPRRTRVDWDIMYPKADKQGLDLLSKLLSFNPNKRYTANDAINHPYMAHYYDPSVETSNSKINNIQPFTFDMELDDLPLKNLSDMIIQETTAFKVPITETNL